MDEAVRWLTGAGAAAADGATKPPLVTEGGGEHAAAVTEQQRHGEHTWKRGGEKWKIDVQRSGGNSAAGTVAGCHAAGGGWFKATWN